MKIRLNHTKIITKTTIPINGSKKSRVKEGCSRRETDCRQNVNMRPLELKTGLARILKIRLSTKKITVKMVE
jgi:hypothetical protein